ncbi:interferon alpha/beta receptor 1a-like [Poecilia reticulata]|uniref:interferon alpha/beta receptor 1a-like n=1 Tax=Poecilia reticulata TaxID=8081 RepID=UPI0004A422F8|nr:PREDICTED: interferon alpha/beta receptor 1a-like [Poecilia reticulata]
MLALVRLCLLLVCLKGSAAEAELTPPHDLFMLTLNTNYTLAWDWDQSAAGSDSATFTVQYTGNHQLQKRNPKWTTVCAETSGRSCDLTRSGLYYLGCYTVRVQTNLNGSHSAWKSLQFCPNKDALIGPPSVSLLPIGQTLEVSIKDPEFKMSSLRNVYSRVRYNITYWKEGQEEQARTHSDVQQDWVVLDNLDPSTKYCVQVRINLTNRSRIESSSVLCERTGDTGTLFVFDSNQ